MSNQIMNQVRINLLSIISVIIAIIALSYNTWRDELTERNRTYRAAGFEVLKNLGELQLLANTVFYQPDNKMVDIMMGWGHIALISDISRLLPKPVPETVDNLVETWKTSWSDIQKNETSQDQLTEQIDKSRDAVSKSLAELR